MSGDCVGRLYVLVAAAHLAHLHGTGPSLALATNPILDNVIDDVEEHGVEAEPNQNVERDEPQDPCLAIVDHAQVTAGGNQLVCDADGREQTEGVEEAVNQLPDAGLQGVYEEAAQQDVAADDEDGEHKWGDELCLLRAFLNVFRLVLEVVVLVHVVYVQVVRLVEVALLQFLLELIPLPLQPHSLLLLLHEDLIVAAVATLGAQAAAHGVGEAVLGALGQDLADVTHVDEEDGDADDSVDDCDELGGLRLVLVRVGVTCNHKQTTQARSVNKLKLKWRGIQCL